MIPCKQNCAADCLWCQFLSCFAEAWVEKPSFGKSLEDHLNISGREIAFPIEACVTMLLECGMQEEVWFYSLLKFLWWRNIL